MEPGNPEGGALTHVLAIVAHFTFSWAGSSFYYPSTRKEDFLLASLASEKLPQLNQETITTLNSCFPPTDLPSKQPFPTSSLFSTKQYPSPSFSGLAYGFP